MNQQHKATVRPFWFRSRWCSLKTHDLLELQKLCLFVDPTFELIGDLLDRLTPYSVEFRHPGEKATMDEAKAAVKVMKAVRQFMQERLDL